MSYFRWVGMGFLGLWAQSMPLRKENTFTFTEVRYAKDTLHLGYEIPFDGVIELRVLQGDNVLHFAQWPSRQGKRSRGLYIKNLPAGSTLQVRYKGKMYTTSVK